MKKRYVVLLGIILSFVIIISSLSSDNEEIKTSSKTLKHENDVIALMYETEIDSGEYEKNTSNSWPTTDYVLNEKLSRCINGSKIYYDKEENKVMVEANTEDKCYVYFDQYVYHKHCDESLLACKVAKNYGSDSTLLLHNEILENGAEDGSYRYSGKDEDVKNYVCFGSDEATCPSENLYRIIGVFDEQVKLIMADYATSSQLGTNGDYSSSTYTKSSYSTYKGKQNEINRYYWNYSSGTNSTNYWADSRLNKINLNTNYIDYLNKINVKWGNMIYDTTWNVGGLDWTYGAITQAKTAYNYELSSTGTGKNIQEKALIGLMYVSDYYYAANPLYWIYPGSNSDATNDYRAAANENWMYVGLSEWTISRSAASTSAYRIYMNGNVELPVVYSSHLAIRPVFYLKSIVMYSKGSGTSTDPFRIS